LHGAQRVGRGVQVEELDEFGPQAKFDGFTMGVCPGEVFFRGGDVRKGCSRCWGEGRDGLFRGENNVAQGEESVGRIVGTGG